MPPKEIISCVVKYETNYHMLRRSDVEALVYRQIILHKEIRPIYFNHLKLLYKQMNHMY